MKWWAGVCLLCMDPHKGEQVEALIERGLPATEVARLVGGVSHDTVSRHKKHCGRDGEMKASDLKWLDAEARKSGFKPLPTTANDRLLYEDDYHNRVVVSRTSNDRSKLASSAALFRKYARARDRLGASPSEKPAATLPHTEPSPTNEKVIPMPEPVKPLDVREPTPDQRFKIRSILDKSFDDAAGMYLDGLDDQKVAEAAGVPRVIVERMRETAYGPIKITAEQAAAKMEIAALREELARLATQISDLEARLFPARKLA